MALSSRFTRKKSDSLKEIDAWVKDGDLFRHEASRASGTLNDNVTEERMLKSKLYDLSRERYKFLTQSAYEKKIFMDQVQRRAAFSAGRRSGPGSDDRQSARDRDVFSSLSRANRRESRTESGYDRDMTLMALQKLQKHLDPALDPSRGKAVHFNVHDVVSIHSDEVGTVRVIVSAQEHKRSRDYPSDLISLPENATIRSTDHDQLEVEFPNRVSPGLLPPHIRQQQTRSSRSYRSTGSSVSSSWNRQIGSRLLSPNIVSDPRFCRLTESLTPIYASRNQTDVPAIIQQIESLHVPPKIHKNVRPKLGGEVLDFLRQRGIVV